jgi:hypothetical protein
VPEVGELVALGRQAGLAAVAVASAEPFESTLGDLEDRKSRGLHGGMAFTYRNPARSTAPERALPGARALVVGAWSYLRPEPAERGSRQGVVARYAWDDYYGQLRGALGQVARRLADDGWKARVLADDNALVDRAAAQRAGLGCRGRGAGSCWARWSPTRRWRRPVPRTGCPTGAGAAPAASTAVRPGPSSLRAWSTLDVASPGCSKPTGPSPGSIASLLALASTAATTARRSVHPTAEQYVT